MTNSEQTDANRQDGGRRHDADAHPPVADGSVAGQSGQQEGGALPRPPGERMSDASVLPAGDAPLVAEDGVNEGLDEIAGEAGSRSNDA